MGPNQLWRLRKEPSKSPRPGEALCVNRAMTPKGLFTTKTSATKLMGSPTTFIAAVRNELRVPKGQRSEPA
jgi:hypothetical protein